MTWYIGFRCAIQLPPGDQGDPTFTGRLEHATLTSRPGDTTLTDPNYFERQTLAPAPLAAVATAVVDRVLGGLAGKHHHLETAAHADMSDVEAIAKLAGGATGTGGGPEGRANLRVRLSGVSSCNEKARAINRRRLITLTHNGYACIPRLCAPSMLSLPGIVPALLGAVTGKGLPAGINPGSGGMQD